MAGFECCVCYSHVLWQLNLKWNSFPSHHGPDLLYIHFFPFKMSYFCKRRVFCSILQLRIRQMLISLPTQSGFLLVTCYLSFSPTTWEIMGSRGMESGECFWKQIKTCPAHPPPLLTLPSSVGFISPFNSQANFSPPQMSVCFLSSILQFADCFS